MDDCGETPCTFDCEERPTVVPRFLKVSLRVYSTDCLSAQRPSAARRPINNFPLGDGTFTRLTVYTSLARQRLPPIALPLRRL